jgi:phage antirepressor YoqD-like protein
MAFDHTTYEKNSFLAYYDNLNSNERIRLRDIAIICCDISESTFYLWLKDFTVITRPHRWIIAKVFNVDQAELFKPKTTQP